MSFALSLFVTSAQIELFQVQSHELEHWLSKDE